MSITPMGGLVALCWSSSVGLPPVGSLHCKPSAGHYLLVTPHHPALFNHSTSCPLLVSFPWSPSDGHHTLVTLYWLPSTGCSLLINICWSPSPITFLTLHLTPPLITFGLWLSAVWFMNRSLPLPTLFTLCWLPSTGCVTFCWLTSTIHFLLNGIHW